LVEIIDWMEWKPMFSAHCQMFENMRRVNITEVFIMNGKIFE
jgi:hypothetical protein